MPSTLVLPELLQVRLNSLPQGLQGHIGRVRVIARELAAVHAVDQDLVELGRRIPSNDSPDFGRPFGDIFDSYERDFYKIDPLLFSPAAVQLVNVDTGNCHDFGACCPEVLQQSFGVG